MKPIHLARVLSGILIGMLFGYYIHYDYLRWSQRGREAYLAHQNLHFEKYIATPHPPVTLMIGTVIMMGAFFGMYELLAAIFTRILRALDSNTSAPSGVG